MGEDKTTPKRLVSLTLFLTKHVNLLPYLHSGFYRTITIDNEALVMATTSAWFVSIRLRKVYM